MPRKKRKSVGDMIGGMRDGLTIAANDNNDIPDIITFCESPLYLGLPRQGVYLFPVQRMILKVFYRGSEGNENIRLTEEEITLCHDLGLDKEDRGNILEKYNTTHLFRELVLVWGRRSSKDFLTSIIASYEAMKLLKCGDPYAKYGISKGNPITILTVATAAGQATIAFQEIKSKIVNSEFFKDKIDKDAWGQTLVHLLTPQDKEKNLELVKNKLPPDKGSIVLEVGHSNSDSLLGKQIFVLILDEMASYKQTTSASSGERILTALSPSLNTFVRKVKYIGDGGEEREKRIFDSKLICISSPRGQEGIFYRLYQESALQNDRLMCRLPTWQVNPTHTQESLQHAFHGTESEFWMEFGAEFSGTAIETMFSTEAVKQVFRVTLPNRTCGEPGKYYYAHLDPATSSHNYALVIVHKENILNPTTKQTDFIIIVDHIKYWHPQRDRQIQIDEVDDYVIGLKRRFKLALVTYDQWNSVSSIQKMRKNGIPAKCTRYNRHYKMQIFSHLDMLINSGRILIPRHDLLMDEMMNLQRRANNNNTYSVFPKKDGDVRTDDLTDALAGAAYNALAQANLRLPSGKMVNTGIVPSSNSYNYRSMQGTMYGRKELSVLDRMLHGGMSNLPSNDR
jgi:hypothetical protein